MEVVRREANDDQSSGAIRLVECFESLKLWRIAAVARRVDDQEGLSNCDLAEVDRVM